MALRRISSANRGFTLIEMLIVVGLIAAVGGAYLFIDLNSYRVDAFRAERDMVVTLLGQARIDSVNNVFEEPHGIAFFPTDAPDSYVLFVGTTYVAGAASNQYYPGNYKIEFGPGSPPEIVFEQLNGNSNFSGTITLVDPTRNFTSEIAVNREGGLSW